VKKLIPVGVSNRHVHLAQADLEKLFGPGYSLTKYRDLTQRGQFAAQERITVVGPKGKLEGLRIVGPCRTRTQVEIARTDAVLLGLRPPVRYSGDISGTPGATLVGPGGTVELSEGVIVAQRHIHMDPATAREYGVQNGDRVFVAPARTQDSSAKDEARTVIWGNVLIRVHESFVLDFHIDTDEANAAGLKAGDQVFLIPRGLTAVAGTDLVGREAGTEARRRLITETDVRRALLRKEKIRVGPEMLITPAAWELGKGHDVFV